MSDDRFGCVEFCGRDGKQLFSTHSSYDHLLSHTHMHRIGVGTWNELCPNSHGIDGELCPLHGRSGTMRHIFCEHGRRLLELSLVVNAFVDAFWVAFLENEVKPCRLGKGDG